MQNVQNNNRNTLAQLTIGDVAQVVSIKGDTPISKRLMEMGVVPGVSIKVIKTAPFGCTLETRVSGYHLALRKSEAETIEVLSQTSEILS